MCAVANEPYAVLISSGSAAAYKLLQGERQMDDRKSARDIATQLLATLPSSPTSAPAEPGFYAWWCRRKYLSDASPMIPHEPRPPVPEEWSLLYVGISPSTLTSRRHLAARLIKNHAHGNIGASTFRLSVASLLLAKLDLQPRTGSDRARVKSEEPLTAWIERSCGVTFAITGRPWEFEAAVITQLNPPLNLDRGTHPFRLHVQKERAALRRSCGL